MIQTIPLAPGVTLRCFPDKRFKQSCLSLQFLRNMRREEAALNALLPAVLLRGSITAPDLRDITLRLDDLYGASVGALVRRIGDYQTTGLYCSFMEDRFAFSSDIILEPMIAFLQELLLQPILENDRFRTDYVESEKRNLISAIASQRNDKRAYANSQLMKHMCRADSFGIPRLGDIAQAEAVDANKLYHHYRQVLQTSPVELFYVGSAAPEQVAELLKPLCQALAANAVPLPPQTPFQDAPGGAHTQNMEISQGRLCMGFVTPTTLRSADFAAMQVCNSIFGGGMTSKLFMQIRERMSLCYDIGSGYHGSKGIVTVSAGIDFDKEDLVREEILAQLDACRKGEISDDELLSAKQGIITQLQATHDSPGAIEGYYASGVLSGLNMTPEAYIQAVEAVTLPQIMEAAQHLQLHTTYFLKGVQ